MRKTVLGFPRAIYNVKIEEPPELKGKFLDPWTSLRPSFIREQIANEIIGLFEKEENQIKFKSFFDLKNSFINPVQTVNHWALVFPKRSYLPQDRPHLQLWYLANRFVPSLKFMDKEEVEILSEASKIIKDIFIKFSQEIKKGTFCFGYNATPFSFIRDAEGRYYAGGQSVRVFHSHYLLMMPEIEIKRIPVAREDLYLVYPTDFSLKLFKLIFGSPEINKQLFQGIKFWFDKKGLLFEYPFVKGSPEDFKNLWLLLKKIDEIFYQIQLILIYAFYQDGKKFIFQLEKFITTQNISLVEERLKELILIGKERNLAEIKIYLKEGLERFAEYNNLAFDQKEITSLFESLSLNLKGDLASWVFGIKTVLRPGMGYGCLARLVEDKFRLRIAPLDVLGPKGLMEASGYWFEKKIEVDYIPDWLGYIAEQLAFRKTIR